MCRAVSGPTMSEEVFLEVAGQHHGTSCPRRVGRLLPVGRFGAVAAFGLLILGTLAVAPILLAGWIARTRPSLRRSWVGVMAGVGMISLYVAYVQRRGPGTICWQTATRRAVTST